MDEINIALCFDILETRASGAKVVLTGRYASERIIEEADLVTNMGEVKHYYNQAVIARKGIED